MVRARVRFEPNARRCSRLIFTTDGRAMRGRLLYRYCLSTRDAKEGHGASGVRMLPAGEIEEAVVAQLRGILRAPEMVTHVWREIAKRGRAAGHFCRAARPTCADGATR
jgi:hypothetical protein